MNSKSIYIPRDSRHPVDEVISAWELFIYGLQNVVVMYTGAITVPLVLGLEIGLDKGQIAYLIQADLITCGIATIIQTVGFWRFGVRLPMIQGLTFAALSPLIIIGTDPNIAANGPTDALQVMYGSVIIAGLASLLFAPLGRYLVRIFPPIVVSAVMISIGLSLIPVGVDYFTGGHASDAGDLSYYLLGSLVLLFIILFYKYTSGFVKNITIFLAFIFGYIISAVTGQLDLSAVPNADYVAFITPFHFGAPKFEFAPTFALLVVMLTVWLESIGTAVIVGDVVDKKPTKRQISDLLRADGLTTVIGACLNSFMYVSITENTTLITISGQKSRWIVATSGVLLMILGASPFLATIVASVPKPVIGAIGMVVFSSLVIFGIKIVQKVDFETSFHNFIVLGLSVVACITPLIQPHFFDFLPSELATIYQSPAITGTLTAIVLNLFMNGLDKTTDLLAD